MASSALTETATDLGEEVNKITEQQRLCLICQNLTLESLLIQEGKFGLQFGSTSRLRDSAGSGCAFCKSLLTSIDSRVLRDGTAAIFWDYDAKINLYMESLSDPYIHYTIAGHRVTSVDDSFRMNSGNLWYYAAPGISVIYSNAKDNANIIIRQCGSYSD
jgi:hypothetical protein